MEAKEVSSSLIVRKMAALEKGELTDCTFLVGPDEADAQLIHACKFDLVVASEYFACLLRSPLTPPGPIRVKHVDPAVFKLVVEYVHSNGQLVTEVNDLGECLKLSAAADEFLLEGLGQLCIDFIFKLVNVDNVWTIFSENHLVKFTSAACEKLLCSNTEQCLRRKDFLKIDEKILAKFLKFDKMNIQSEMVLVRACLKYVKGRGKEREVFRRVALPHLRLLTLSADDLAELAPFLRQKEKMFLSLNLLQDDPLLLRDGLEETNLNKVTSKRNCGQAERNLSTFADSGTIDLITDQSVFDLKKIFMQEQYLGLNFDTRFVMNFESKNSIKITKFELLCLIDWNLFSREQGERVPSSRAFVWVSNAVVTVLVAGNGNFKESGALKPKYVSQGVAHFENLNFNVPKGCFFRVEVILKNPSYIIKVPALNVKNKEGTCTYSQQYWRFNRYETVEKPTLTVFKSFSYEKIK